MNFIDDCRKCFGIPYPNYCKFIKQFEIIRIDFFQIKLTNFDFYLYVFLDRNIFCIFKRFSI